jgi:hypothetical protein
MPYKCEKDNIPTQLKRSSKLSEDDKEEMRRLRQLSHSDWSYNALGREFGVSKRTAYWVINPDKQKENYQKRVERGGSKQYYDREKHTNAMRDHRKYKKQLADEGKLISTN